MTSNLTKKSIWLLGLVFLSLPPVDLFLDGTMPRHMVIQPLIFIIWGFWGGRLLQAHWLNKYNHYGLSGLLFLTGSMIYWMFPRTLDATLAFGGIDFLYHLNMLLNGFLLQKSLPLMPYLLRAVYGVHLIAMFSAVGIFYRVYDDRACTVYPFIQQRQVANLLLFLGLFGYACHWYWIVTVHKRKV